MRGEEKIVGNDAFGFGSREKVQSKKGAERAKTQKPKAAVRGNAIGLHDREIKKDSGRDDAARCADDLVEFMRAERRRSRKAEGDAKPSVGAVSSDAFAA